MKAIFETFHADTQQIGKFLEYPSQGTLIFNRLESFWNSLHKERTFSTDWKVSGIAFT
jgi:threonyl-tRNA synthetase